MIFVELGKFISLDRGEAISSGGNLGTNPINTISFVTYFPSIFTGEKQS
jgi:hypothetical protein